MELQLCDFEQSVKLKEIGFDWEGYKYYDNLKYLNHAPHRSNYNDVSAIVSAPTIALALMWLREVKGLLIYVVDAYNSTNERHYHYYVRDLNKAETAPACSRHQGNATYAQAETAALTHALKLLTDKKEI
jgi:hypothetical protein